ncbi:tyrosine-type recombinase/integrase [Aneurinibacillus danicus]|uniref:Site-specific integrase n=1 Tax=Aneurinibacillus danicus TaxID=267746 RepID=A0A511VCP5_9BACL|nr:tyrosine-type recombinase/integrase [Aneurinibacillus danicus]GEN36629.1 site-specific integrase [Aneurinibacillus danicus]
MAGSLEQRGKDSWRLMVYGGRGPDGKEIRYRKTVKGINKREAEKELAKFVAEVYTGNYIDSPKITLAEFISQWMKIYAEKELSPTTVQGYEGMLTLRILPALGHVELDKLKPIHLLKFYDNLKEDGIRLDGKPGALSQQSILHHHRLISSILGHAVKWQIIPINVAKSIEPPKVEEKEMEFYNEEEVALILHYGQEEEFQYFVLVTLAITTGLRRGELLGLEWDHINFDAKTLKVKKTSQYINRKGLITKGPKSKSSKRTLSLTDEEIALLSTLKKLHEEKKETLGSKWLNSNRLFITWNGGPMHPNTVNNWFKKFTIKHNIPVKNFHSLRHTNITLLLSQNVDLMTVIMRAGHSDGSMILRRYGHAIPAKEREASDKIGSIVFKNKKIKHPSN